MDFMRSINQTLNLFIIRKDESGILCVLSRKTEKLQTNVRSIGELVLYNFGFAFVHFVSYD